MTNNPLVHFKPGLTMDAPVSVTMAAADWAVFMAWIANIDQEGTLDGVRQIIYQNIGAQVGDALYDKASLKAAETAFMNRQQDGPFGPLMRAFSGQPTVPDTPASLYDGQEVWLLRCAQCGSLDEYAPRHNGPLTCGHDGMRIVEEVKFRPAKDDNDEG